MEMCVQLLLMLMPLFVFTDETKNWALLFTGANGYRNYPSHSALCHAYHTLHAAGIPDERVVVIMYDDVANSSRNRYPGKLFNNYTRIDVYKGTPIDYSGTEISAELILAVLKGDKETVKHLIGREGKVIDSGPEDNVFVGAVGHGLPGQLLMPNGTMKARQIIRTLEDMHENKRFSKLVFYLEACASGSIFQDLPKDIDVYAITAAGPNQLAFMNYCEDPDFEQDKICLGSQFTNGWIENTERINVSSFTLDDQSKVIKTVVNKSNPELFGDLSILKLPLQAFFGRTPNHQEQIFGGGVDSIQQPAGHPHHASSTEGAVPYHLMYLTLIKRRLQKSPSDKKLQDELERVQYMMAQVDDFFYQAAKMADTSASKARRDKIISSTGEPIRNWDCYEAATDAVMAFCPGVIRREETEGYALSKFSVLVNLCNRLSGHRVVTGVKRTALSMSICQFS